MGEETTKTIRYAFLMAVSTCTVSFKDLDRLTHCVTVDAESLIEAFAVAVSVSQADNIAPARCRDSETKVPPASSNEPIRVKVGGVIDNGLPPIPERSKSAGRCT